MAKLLFIGPPGSGKGTQCKLLKKYGFSHLSSGDLIRSSTDPLIVKYREQDYPKGLLLEDKLLFNLLEKSLPKNFDKYTLDGFVRTLPQAKYAKKKGLVDLVFYIKVYKKTAIGRILKRNEGRKDDNPKSIGGRFLEYQNKTKPTLDYLKKNFEFYEIDGSKTIEEVNREVLKILGINE
ncbi:MAG: nucleoside monophosphate kinase [Nanoarchaeota archaeon]|nr:nucleoside monophosphate kinase [Nanoarchaeota archaeon]